MTFPLKISGSGEIVGKLVLPGFRDELQIASADVQLESTVVSLSRQEVEYFNYVLREQRELLGSSFLRRSADLHIHLSDGGYLAATDYQREIIVVPFQLLLEDALPIGEDARRLVLDDAMISVVYALLGSAFCRGLHRFIDRFANPTHPLWDSRQHVVLVLSGLHRFMRMELDQQVLLRDAYERIEIVRGERKPYAEMLRDLQGCTSSELPEEFVARAIGIVNLDPELFPDYYESGLASNLRAKYPAAADGDLKGAAQRWLLKEHRLGREVTEVLWKEHIAPAIQLEKALVGINLKHNRPEDVFRKVAGTSNLTKLAPLYSLGESDCGLDAFLRPLEELCQELQINLGLGVENIRTYSQLVLNWLAEREGTSSYPGDRVEFLKQVAEKLKRAKFRAATRAVHAYIYAIDEELLYLARRYAVDEQAQTEAREASRRAHTRLFTRLSSTAEDVAALNELLGSELVRQEDFLPEDARRAVNDLVRHFRDKPELLTPIRAHLEQAAKSAKAAYGFKTAMQRRYSLTHDRSLDYSGHSSTELLEIFCSLLIFEDQVPELEDTEGKLEIRRQAYLAMNKEKGLLKGMVVDRKTRNLVDISSGDTASRITKSLVTLMTRAERGKVRAAADLADARFRLGLLAAVEEDVPNALTHFRELVRYTLDDELVTHCDGGHLKEKIDPGVFRAANDYFRAREVEIRRAKAAGDYLELFARRAERELSMGRRPEIGHEHLEKILQTLEMGRVLGDRAPTYRILRYLPRIVSLGDKDYRIRDLLPAGAGGQAGQMALFRHLFSDEPFVEFMGYKIVETESELGNFIKRYVSKLGINDHIRAEFIKVFARLFPNFEAEMKRQRNGLPNQIFTKLLLDALVAHMRKTRSGDADLLRPFDARVVKIGEGARAFPVLMLEFIPGLQDDLPKTLFAHQQARDGSLPRKPGSLVSLETAVAKVREDVRRRLDRDKTYLAESMKRARIDKDIVRMRAHSAALAVLLANVDHQIFTVGGRLVAMDYEILLAPCFDAEWNVKEAQANQPVSTYFTKRINVSWVTERDELMPYLEVAGLYRTCVYEHRDALKDWATEAGYTSSEADQVSEFVLANSARLARDLTTLVKCNGTAYLCGNRKRPDGSMHYGHLIQRTDMDRGEDTQVIEGEAASRNRSGMRASIARLKSKLAEAKREQAGGDVAAGAAAVSGDERTADWTSSVRAHAANERVDEDEKTADFTSVASPPPVVPPAPGDAVGEDESTVDFTTVPLPAATPPDDAAASNRVQEPAVHEDDEVTNHVEATSPGGEDKLSGNLRVSPFAADESEVTYRIQVPSADPELDRQIEPTPGAKEPPAPEPPAPEPPAPEPPAPEPPAPEPPSEEESEITTKLRVERDRDEAK